MKKQIKWPRLRSQKQNPPLTPTFMPKLQRDIFQDIHYGIRYHSIPCSPFFWLNISTNIKATISYVLGFLCRRKPSRQEALLLFYKSSSVYVGGTDLLAGRPGQKQLSGSNADTPCNDKISRSSKLLDLFIIITQYCYYSNTVTSLFSQSDIYLLVCVFLICRDIRLIHQIFFFLERSSQSIFAKDPIYQAWTSQGRLSQSLGPKQPMRTSDHAHVNYIISLYRKYIQVQLRFLSITCSEGSRHLPAIDCIHPLCAFLSVSENSTHFVYSKQFTSKKGTERPRRTVYRPNARSATKALIAKQCFLGIMFISFIFCLLPSFKPFSFFMSFSIQHCLFNFCCSYCTDTFTFVC